MVHHVALEVRPDLMAAEGKFWVAAGFEPVAAPEGLGAGFDWYEREGTQIHVMAVGQPGEPSRRGHVAIVATFTDRTHGDLAVAGPVEELAQRRALYDDYLRLGRRLLLGRLLAGRAAP